MLPEKLLPFVLNRLQELHHDYGFIVAFYPWGSFELEKEPVMAGSLPTKEATAKMLRAIADKIDPQGAKPESDKDLINAAMKQQMDRTLSGLATLPSRIMEIGTTMAIKNHQLREIIAMRTGGPITSQEDEESMKLARAKVDKASRELKERFGIDASL